MHLLLLALFAHRARSNLHLVFHTHTHVLSVAATSTEQVPTICSRLGGHAQRVRAAITLGSVPPLLMCLGWNAG
jgi:hypothetical protein